MNLIGHEMQPGSALQDVQAAEVTAESQLSIISTVLVFYHPLKKDRNILKIEYSGFLLLPISDLMCICSQSEQVEKGM